VEEHVMSGECVGVPKKKKELSINRKALREGGV